MSEAFDQKTMITPMAGLSVLHNDRGTGVLLPRNLGDASDRSGLFLEETPPGSKVEVSTANHGYVIELTGARTAVISGHPEYCPEPVQVVLHGTRWLDSEIKKCYLAPGMRLQFVTQAGVSVLTSPIEAVRLVAPA